MTALEIDSTLSSRPPGPPIGRPDSWLLDMSSDFLALKSELSTAQVLFDQGGTVEAQAMLQQLILRIEHAASRYGRFKSAELVGMYLLNAEAKTLLGLACRSKGEEDEAQAVLAQAISEFEAWLPASVRQNSQTLASYALALEAVGRHDQAIVALEKAVAQGSISAPACLLLARYRQAQGDWSAAAELCRQAVDLAPAFLAAHQTLADILESQGLVIDALASYHQIVYLQQAAERLDEALAVAYHIRALKPDDIDNLVVLGELLRASGESGEALSVLDDALSLDSSNTRALSSHGAALITLGRYEDALRSLDQVLSFDPTSAWALAAKGDTLRILGRYDEALDALEQALALFGDEPWVLGTKGEVLRAMGRTAEAVTTLRRVNEITPGLAWIQVELSAALRDSGQFEDALLAVDQASDLLPDDLEILMVKVDLLSALERFDKALEVVDDILQREPGFANALWLRSDVLRQLGRNEEALAALDQLLMLDPTNAVFSGTRGLVLRSMGQQRKAAGALIRAVKLGNCPAWVEIELASLLIDLGLPRQALKMLAEVTEVEPGNAAAWGYTGEALRLLDRHDEALTALGKSLDIEPDNTYALGTKAQVLKAVGRKDESIEAFRQAIMLMPSWSWLHVELGELAGYDLVLVALDDALKEFPRNPRALSAKGEALRLLGRFRDALAFLDKALEFVPEDPFTLATKGQVLIALKDNDAAGDALLRAVKIDAELGWAYSGLSALDRQQDALDILQQALENDPRNWRLLNIQGQMLSDIGEFQRAAESHLRAIDLSPEDAESYSNLGWALLNLGRGSNALHAYQNAWRYEASPCEDLWIRRGLADALMVAGDVKSGRVLFRDLIEEIERSFSNRDAYILSLLGWCHYQLGHVESSHYEKALSHYSDALAQALGDILSTQFDLALVLLCMDRGSAARQEYQWGLKLARERSELRQRGLLLVALQDLREAEQIRSKVQRRLEATLLSSIRTQLEDRLQEISVAIKNVSEVEQVSDVVQSMAETARLEAVRQRLEDHSREIDSVEPSRKTEVASQFPRRAQ